MGFVLGDVIIDRIQYGWAEKFDGTPLYIVSQLADGTINITAESKDATDKDGTLVKRFWNAKTGTFEANNAMISMPLVASKSGITPDIVSDGVVNGGNAGTLTMPKIMVVDAGREYTLTGIVEGTLHVTELTNSGAMGAICTAGGSASDTTYVLSGTSFTAPSKANTQYIIKYNRTVSNGAIVHNEADKFPETIKLYLKCLAVDPCSADTLKALYVELPSFQPSPEMEIGLNVSPLMRRRILQSW